MAERLGKPLLDALQVRYNAFKEGRNTLFLNFVGGFIVNSIQQGI